MQQELKEHYFKCEPMKKHYGELFTLIVKYNHKDLKLDQKMSLDAVVDMFSNEIKNNVLNDARKNGHPVPQCNDVVYVPQQCQKCLLDAMQPAMPNPQVFIAP